MKKVTSLLLAVTALMYFSSVNGQTSVGVKAGVNIANMTDNNFKARIGVHGGIFVNRSVAKSFFVQPEVLFSSEGQQYIWMGTEHKWILNYIQVPVMLQYYPVSQVYIEAGPQVGFLVSARDKIPGAASHPNMKANINSVQFAIGAGLGVKLSSKLAVYGRYNFGMTDITTSYYDNFDIKSNVAQIGIAARLK